MKKKKFIYFQVKEDRARWTAESLKTVSSSHKVDGICTCRICLPPWIQQ